MASTELETRKSKSLPIFPHLKVHNDELSSSMCEPLKELWSGDWEKRGGAAVSYGPLLLFY